MTDAKIIPLLSRLQSPGGNLFVLLHRFSTPVMFGEETILVPSRVELLAVHAERIIKLSFEEFKADIESGELKLYKGT
jgi:hypothetical protein